MKLGDFGFCKALKQGDPVTTTMIGSPIYMAP
jgi:serine/threonine-protein kinase ULK/ATG1